MEKKKGRGRRGPDRIEVFKVEKNITLLPFLQEIFSDRSKTTIKSYLTHRQIAINNTPMTQFDTPLHPGDEVSVNYTRGYKEFRHPRLRIVYEDEFLIVVDKGYGLLSISTDRVKANTAYHILSDYVRQDNPANRIFVLHRLDRDTSGLMMFAKSQGIQEKMQRSWNDMVLDRRYVAVVEGEPSPSKGEVSSYLKENAAFHVYSTDDKENGQYALTRYEVLATTAAIRWWNCNWPPAARIRYACICRTSDTALPETASTGPIPIRSGAFRFTPAGYASYTR